MELQFEADSNCYILPLSGQSTIFINYNYIDIGTKFNLLAINKWNISLTPYLGLFTNFNTSYHLYGIFFDFGGFSIIKFIANYNTNNDNSIYFGFSIQINKRIVTYKKYDLFEFESGLSIGWEIEKRGIARHEICISNNFDFSNQNIFDNSIALSFIGVSLSYNLSIGNRYYRKNNESEIQNNNEE